MTKRSISIIVVGLFFFSQAIAAQTKTRTSTKTLSRTENYATACNIGIDTSGIFSFELGQLTFKYLSIGLLGLDFGGGGTNSRMFLGPLGLSYPVWGENDSVLAFSAKLYYLFDPLLISYDRDPKTLIEHLKAKASLDILTSPIAVTIGVGARPMYEYGTKTWKHVPFGEFGVSINMANSSGFKRVEVVEHLPDPDLSLDATAEATVKRGGAVSIPIAIRNTGKGNSENLKIRIVGSNHLLSASLDTAEFTRLPSGEERLVNLTIVAADTMFDAGSDKLTIEATDMDRFSAASVVNVKYGPDKAYTPALYSALLVEAIKTQKAGLVSELLRRDFDRGFTEEATGRSFLSIAAEAGNASIILQLMKAGFRPEAGNPLHKKLPFIHAVNSLAGEFPALAELGFDLDSPNEKGTTPLMAASGKGNLDILKYLISWGADPFAYDQSDDDALMYAVKSDQSVAAAYLLSVLKERQTVMGGRSFDIDAVLDAACKAGAVKALKPIVDAGASINGDLFTIPLFTAIDGDHLETISELARLGADVKKKYLGAISCVDWALLSNGANKLRIASLLFASGAVSGTERERKIAEDGLVLIRLKDTSASGAAPATAVYVENNRYGIDDLYIFISIKDGEYLNAIFLDPMGILQGRAAITSGTMEYLPTGIATSPINTVMISKTATQENSISRVFKDAFIYKITLYYP